MVASSNLVTPTLIIKDLHESVSPFILLVFYLFSTLLNRNYLIVTLYKGYFAIVILLSYVTQTLHKRSNLLSLNQEYIFFLVDTKLTQLLSIFLISLFLKTEFFHTIGSLP